MFRKQTIIYLWYLYILQNFESIQFSNVRFRLQNNLVLVCYYLLRSAVYPESPTSVDKQSFVMKLSLPLVFSMLSLLVPRTVSQARDYDDVLQDVL